MTVKWIDKGNYLVTEDGVWSEQSSGILKEQALDSLSSDVVKYWRPDGVIVMVPPVMGATKQHYRLYSGVEESLGTMTA